MFLALDRLFALTRYVFLIGSSYALLDMLQLITITQYLRPTPMHHPVVDWIKPQVFVELAQEAEEIGFLGVMSGPLVRSSYRAGRLYKQALEKKSHVTQ